MKITIYPPISFCQIGMRQNNEDAMYPPLGEATENDRLFIVCDGVGGAYKGEIASKMVSELFASNFKFHYEGNNSQDFFNKLILFVEVNLSNYKDAHPECFQMATTLTFLLLHTTGCTIGWCGDSRIYHVRDGKILYKTRDHSLVNKMVDSGEISEIEAKNHPKRNVILRAVSGQETPTRVDIRTFADVQPDDYFMLCTDGVLEFTTENLIENWFIKSNTPEQIKEKILANSQLTKDNYSMYLIKIKSME